MYNLDSQIKSLKCSKEQHNNSEILELLLDDGIKLEDRFLCKFCIQIQNGWHKKTGIIPVLETIQQQYQDLEKHQTEQLNQEKKYLTQLQEDFKEFQTQIQSTLSEIENLILQLNKELEYTQRIIHINLIEEIELYIKEQTNKKNLDIIENFNQDIQNIKNSYNTKFENKIQNFNLLNCQIFSKYKNNQSRNQEEENKLLENNYVRQSKIKIIINNGKEKAIKLNYISEIQCLECSALAFDNETSKLVVCGGQKQIQILKMQDGIIKEKISTLQHNESIFSVVYSKNQNWLAVGTDLGIVKTWKLQNSEWESSPPQYSHKKSVFCLILSKNEDFLFSCSEDQSIIIWSLIIAQNKIQKKQQITTDKGSLFSLSLNDSENKLAACSRKDAIIICEKQSNNEWILKQIIQLPEKGFGFRLCFYGEDYLIFQPQNEGISKVYQLKDNIFEQRKELEIELQEKEQKDMIGLSPIQYNNFLDVMMLKHANCVYFIKKLSNQKFAIIGSSPKKQNIFHTFTVSQDGQYYAEWTNEKKIYIYRIDYQ
ncbi:unnamed protein product [Paramecium sonneborni]|uniref:WD40-repeat-containing domain n=1 Tax=Paramecium sonneborni TaxID=65129 RepID=A0A8S1MJ25_9CILI|nr:unnamed protein product [Paramecium sonneborni]